jgi:cell division protein FtsW (lipid II flippase)
MTNIMRRGCLLLFAMIMVVSVSSLSEKTEDTRGTATPSVYAVHYIDPDIVDSEWNHHVAGYVLIASAILYVIGLSVSPLSWARSSWIILLIAAAVFLAVWSDKEIWPRGTLNWIWLIHHDAEARQHKIYAILLFVIALVEYFRQSGKLSRFWGTWAFPTLAVLGAFFLLMHSHDGHSGLPAGWDEAEKHAQLLKMAGLSAMPMHTDASRGDAAPEHHGHNIGMPAMPMSQLQQGAAGSMQAGHSGSEHHRQGGAFTHVEKQHLWFAVIGIALAVFKWADDGQFWRNKYATYLWPCSMLALGVLLALYTEIK